MRNFQIKVVDMVQMNLTPLSTVVDEVWGKEGTPKRDAMESQLKEEVKLLCGKESRFKRGCVISSRHTKQNLWNWCVGIIHFL